MAEQGPTKGKIKFKIISPLAPVAEREVDKVLLPLTCGPTLILPRHAPLLTAVKTGKIIITNDGKQETYFISQGVAEIRRDICVVCAWGLAQKDVKPDEIRERLENLKNHPVHSTHEKQITQDLISFLENIL
ncbi:MAG: F0F1 ATP synthase subunit epsilon [Alphaproteobacteria bacterium]